MNRHLDPSDFPPMEDCVEEQAEYLVSRYVQIAAALKANRKEVLKAHGITEDEYHTLESDVAAIVGPEGMVCGEWRVNIRRRPWYVHKGKPAGETYSVFISENRNG